MRLDVSSEMSNRHRRFNISQTELLISHLFWSPPKGSPTKKNTLLFLRSSLSLSMATPPSSCPKSQSQPGTSLPLLHPTSHPAAILVGSPSEYIQNLLSSATCWQPGPAPSSLGISLAPWHGLLFLPVPLGRLFPSQQPERSQIPLQH